MLDDETLRRRQSLARLPPPPNRKGAAVAENQRAEVQLDRRAKSERRSTSSEDRRKANIQVAVEPAARAPREVPRRRQIDPTTCEREYNDDEIEFMHALDAYKRTSGRMFPTCSEILEVIRDLGYVRTTQNAAPATQTAVETSLDTTESDEAF